MKRPKIGSNIEKIAKPNPKLAQIPVIRGVLGCSIRPCTLHIWICLYAETVEGDIFRKVV